MKILFSIKDKSLILTYNYQKEQEENLLKTNVLKKDKIIFSSEYIEKNGHTVGRFINEAVKHYNIEKIIITKLDMLKTLEKVLDTIEMIDTLYISDEENFTYEAYEIIVRLNKFKKVNCYSIPTYMIELFDKKNIKVESRAEILFTSNFFEENNLVSYSKIYYNTSLKIAPPFTEQDQKDFETFCKINRYLRVIHFNACSVQSIEKLAKILIKNKIKNIQLIVHDNINRKTLIDPLKKIKKILLKYQLYIELQYTEEYVNKNYSKQLILATLITCSFMALIIAGGSLMYVLINNKISEKNVNEISELIQRKIAQDNLTGSNEKNEDGKLSRMASLLELNNDTIGWITVPGTNIDYPVVQKDNNDYYLTHNFNNQFDYNGWVFLNYKNNAKDLDPNTIIFAHNRYDSGVMFGTLSRVTKKEWYNQSENIKIYFNTLYEEYEWQVFSIYEIPVTDDYLKTSFSSTTEYQDFINMIRERSIFQSDVKVDFSDKILTLSTCQDINSRLVVHAVKVK